MKLTTALARLTPSRVKAEVSSGRVRKSRSFLGDQPSRQRKLTNASRQKARVAIGGDADDRAVAALGKLGAVRRDEQRKMRELRGFGSGGLKDQQMLVGVREMILAANDVADAQVGVIGAGGQMIGRHAVAAQQGKVFDLVRQLASARRRRHR